MPSNTLRHSCSSQGLQYTERALDCRGDLYPLAAHGENDSVE